MSDRITVIGNIATVPERRQTSTGIPVASFRLATTTRVRDTAGNWTDGHTNFYSVSAYRRLAEHSLASLQRGQRVIVTGSLKVKKWDTGQKSGTDIDIDAEALGPDLQWGTAAFTVLRREPASGGALGDAGRGTSDSDGIDGEDEPDPEGGSDGEDGSAAGDAWAPSPLAAATPF